MEFLIPEGKEFNHLKKIEIKEDERLYYLNLKDDIQPEERKSQIFDVSQNNNPQINDVENEKFKANNFDQEGEKYNVKNDSYDSKNQDEKINSQCDNQAVKKDSEHENQYETPAVGKDGELENEAENEAEHEIDNNVRLENNAKKESKNKTEIDDTDEAQNDSVESGIDLVNDDIVLIENKPKEIKDNSFLVQYSNSNNSKCSFCGSRIAKVKFF
jgi:hypothetical protein